MAANYRELYEGGGVRVKELAEFSKKEDNNFALTAVIVINIEQTLATIPVAVSHLSCFVFTETHFFVNVEQNSLRFLIIGFHCW